MAAAETPDVILEPVKRSRIYEHIVDQIHALIREGRWAPGDQIPPERELAERFRVSRTSVREALRALESVGLIEIRPGEGTFVREISVDALVEPLALVLLSQRAMIEELFEARRLLEPAIAGLAARRASKDEIQEMERTLEAQAREIKRGHTGLAQDAAFHHAIGTAAHNRAITRIVHAVMDLLAQSREESLSTPGRPTRSHEDHRRILAAIRAGDAAAAERAMRDHVVAVEALVLRAGRKSP